MLQNTPKLTIVLSQGRLVIGVLIVILGLYPNFGFSQHVKYVPEAFEAIGHEPEVIYLSNGIDVPREGGHLQGIQLIEKNGIEKLLISGSSHTIAYVLQADLATRKTDTLISLMKAPYRHAGGIQVSGPYIVVGIEDNYTKTASKVCIYKYRDSMLYRALPSLTIHRKGEAKQKTAGATGLLALENKYLAVVSNWDSRNWDFYSIDLEKKEQKMLASFDAPDNWPSYQSINLIKDAEAIYAIGFYKKDLQGAADLILVSSLRTFEPILENVGTKTFNSTNEVDFGAAAGLQVDDEGKLHIWATQRDALKQIAVNRFSEQ